MSNEMQSIEDLLDQSGAKSTDTKKPDPGNPSVQEKFEEKFEEVRLKEKEQEAERQAAAGGFAYVNLKGFPISPEALSQIPEDQSRDLQVVSFLFTGPEIRIGAVHPEDQKVKDLLFSLQERHKANGKVYKISEASLEAALKLYAALPKVRKIVKGVKITKDELKKFQDQINSYADVQKVLDGTSITDAITIVIAAALEMKTSDIHIEAEEEKIAVRYRIDGVLQDVAALPHENWKKIAARIKLISGLKINITNRPQDGRFTIFLESGDTDVRVSTIPTAWGESVVMRILNPAAVKVPFADLGWRPIVQKKLMKEIEKPHGMIITTGPTGSGKTTTLYGVLQHLNAPGVKIITLEDPIEYKVEGINQSQIDHTKQYTFASGLRSILRQDPDIVMVGEIRDLETAEVAINAALTGHLLLSTLHTNDAAGALPRFISMGVKPFLMAPALNAIIGQRLVRKVCEACKEPQEIPAEQLEEVKKALAEIPEASGETVPPETEWTFFHGKGCDQCNGTGYKGRLGVFEMLTMSEQIQASLSEDISEYKVRELAKEQGMVTMRQDGLLKALEGITTVDEVLRVTG